MEHVDVVGHGAYAPRAVFYPVFIKQCEKHRAMLYMLLDISLSRELYITMKNSKAWMGSLYVILIFHTWYELYSIDANEYDKE